MMRSVLKRIFESMTFLTAIFSFWDMVDIVFNIRSELGTKEIFKNLIQKR